MYIVITIEKKLRQHSIQCVSGLFWCFHVALHAGQAGLQAILRNGNPAYFEATNFERNQGTASLFPRFQCIYIILSLTYCSDKFPWYRKKNNGPWEKSRTECITSFFHSFCFTVRQSQVQKTFVHLKYKRKRRASVCDKSDKLRVQTWTQGERKMKTKRIKSAGYKLLPWDFICACAWKRPFFVGLMLEVPVEHYEHW